MHIVQTQKRDEDFTHTSTAATKSTYTTFKRLPVCLFIAALDVPVSNLSSVNHNNISQQHPGWVYVMIVLVIGMEATR